MRFANPLLILLVTSLVKAAIIPKGISSLLTNSKVPTQAELFVENGQRQNGRAGSGSIGEDGKSNNEGAKAVAVDGSSSSAVGGSLWGDVHSGSNVGFQNAVDPSTTTPFSFQDQGGDDSNTPATAILKQRISALEHFKDTFTDFSPDYDNNKTTAILLSSKIIKNNTLKKLGIKGISFKLPVLGSGFPKTVNEPSFLPINTNSVFFFNLKESIWLDQTRLVGSIPLDIKGNFKIDDYNLLIPITYLQNLKISSVFLEDFLIACNDQILYYNRPLEIDSPLLITVISDSETKASNSASSSPSSSSKLSSLFFELISKNWLQSSVKSIDLLQSAFCFINNEDLKHDNKSVCLRINDNERSIDIAPSFDADNKLNFNEIVPPSASPVHRRRQKREIHPTYGNETAALGESQFFKIQLGNNTLTGNERVFENITKCHEEEAFDVPQEPLNGTLFGEKDFMGMQYLSHAPVLLLQARPASYKQIVDNTEVKDGRSPFTF